ncbi:MAG: hypothetical protein ABJF67_20970 [Aurantimonas coralicida]|jgi:hypothetical protein|uniref:hypothetical protein n=1 Tax=Aurantimonas TaxID=182269 RepID=UPI001D17DEBD|nr:hypothetical protein [Aurantimonas coralicida]MCC4298974.1 hypothetical protein [Aurantimonas coralicida]
MTTDSGKTFRNAGSGQYVTKSYAETHPHTTISETRGGGSTHGAHRSAITGRFVGPAAAGRWPDRTIKDS